MWLTAAVTVSVPITHPASRVVGSGNCQCSGSVASSAELFTVVRPSIWDKSRDFEIGQWGRPWLVWYVPCKRRCVPRFTKLKHRHRHRNDRRWRCETHSLSRNSVTVSRWSARRYFHCLRRTITRITDTMTVKCVQNCLLETMPCASRRKVPGCVPNVRIEHPGRAAWSKHWRQCVWLTCLTRTRVTLASRCSKRTARKLPRCGTGTRAKSTYCDLSSFGPPLFEIWWPDIYLGGPYGPVKDKMYWPELVRRSEKCAGPVLMSRAETAN